MRVYLRSGVVLTYNGATFMDHSSSKSIFILRKKRGDECFEAIFPMEVVERIEGALPCKLFVPRAPRVGKKP